MLRARSLATLFASLVGLFALVSACSGVTRTDSRFATPERTIETLLTSYGLESLTQEQVRERMQARQRFEVQDGDAFRACFLDLDNPVAEGMAGWVLGAIAAGKDELRTEIVEERATVSPREGVRIVLLQRPDRSWRISLAESVPDEMRRALSSVAERHDRRTRELGLPVQD